VSADQAERDEQLAELERDREVVERIAERVDRGRSGKRKGDRRVELHIDLPDVAVLVRHARAHLLGRKRLLEKEGSR
jgi:hypothetical protein